MRIAIVTPVFPPYTSGMGNVAYHHAHILKGGGHDISVLTPNYKNRKTYEEIQEGIRIIRLRPFFQYGNAAWIPNMAKYLGEFDILYLHYPFFGGADVIFRYLKSHKKKLIVYYHMDVVGGYWKNIIFSLYSGIYIPKIIQSSHRVFVSSEDYVSSSFLQNSFQKSREKFEIIPFGVDTKVFIPHKKDKELMRRLGIEGRKVILFVGALDRAHYFKGVENLLRAFKAVSGTYFLVIVGRGDLSSWYKDLAEKLGVQKYVRFCENVTNAELPKYYQLSDVVVLPSIDSSEAFGIVLLEGLSCKKPVIASSLSGVRTVVEDGKNGILVPPSDITALKDALQKILEDDVLADAFGEEGRKKVEAYNSWDIISEKLKEFFFL